jgi:hypothetical protein
LRSLDFRFAFFTAGFSLTTGADLGKDGSLFAGISFFFLFRFSRFTDRAARVSFFTLVALFFASVESGMNLNPRASVFI